MGDWGNKMWEMGDLGLQNVGGGRLGYTMWEM